MTLSPSDLTELETLRWGNDPRAVYRRNVIALRLFGSLKPSDLPIVGWLYQCELAELQMLRRQLAESWGFERMSRAAAAARVRYMEDKFSHPLLCRLFGTPTPLP